MLDAIALEEPYAVRCAALMDINFIRLFAARDVPIRMPAQERPFLRATELSCGPPAIEAILLARLI